MNPLIVAQQIDAARKARETAKWLPRLAYTSVTGDASRVEVTVTGRPAELQEDEAHCFVCGRHTDHYAEHDEYVARGLATYDARTGSVYTTDHFYSRPDLVQAARDEVDASVAAWLAALPA